MIHTVKSWPKYFDDIWLGVRTHELRKNDRNYKVGDYLQLQRWDPIQEIHTGEVQMMKITSITSADIPCAESAGALHKEFCILSIKP